MLKLQKRMQAGFTIIELLIVIAIIGILATLVLTNFQGAQAKGRDVTRKSDINSLYQKLEELYNENGGYPDAALAAGTFTGIDAGALNDADGAVISSTLLAGVLVPGSVSNGTATTTEYSYVGYNGCATPATGFSCGKYQLRTFLEKESNFVKDSLN